MNPQDNVNQTPTPNPQAGGATPTNSQPVSPNQGYADPGISAEPVNNAPDTAQSSAFSSSSSYDSQAGGFQQAPQDAASQPSIGTDVPLSAEGQAGQVSSASSAPSVQQPDSSAENLAAATTAQSPLVQPTDVNPVASGMPSVDPGITAQNDPASLTPATAPVSAPHSEKKTLIMLVGVAVLLAAAIVVLFIM